MALEDVAAEAVRLLRRRADFFAILLPGPILAALIEAHERLLDLTHGIEENAGTAERWIAFLIAAYVLGHLLHAVGSAVLDPLYDDLYRDRWKLGKSTGVLSKLRRLRPKLPGSAAWYETLKTDVKRRAGNSPSPGRLYHWAETFVRLRSDSAATEIQRHSADSKFFRSLPACSSSPWQSPSPATTSWLPSGYWQSGCSPCGGSST